MARAVSGLSPVIITVRMPIRRISSNRSRMPSLTTSLRLITPERAGRGTVDGLGDDQRRAAGGGDGVDDAADLVGGVPAVVAHPLHHRGGGTLADLPAAVEVDAAHPGLRGERHEVRGRELAREPLAQPVRGLGEHHDGAALRGLVGEAGQLGGVGQLARSAHPATGRNSAACRLPSVMVPVLSSSSVFTSPAASTARPDMASTLCCTSRSMPAMPIADSSAPMVVGIRQTSSATSDDQVCSAPE